MIVESGITINQGLFFIDCGLGRGLAKVIEHPRCHEVTPIDVSHRELVEGSVSFAVVIIATTRRHDLGGVDEVGRDGFAGSQLDFSSDGRIAWMGKRGSGKTDFPSYLKIK